MNIITANGSQNHKVSSKQYQCKYNLPLFILYKPDNKRKYRIKKKETAQGPIATM